MSIYCDESGGLPAGAMCFAAVAISPDGADALLDRFRQVTGLRGELKGSRIGLTERALFFELLDRFDGRAWVSTVRRDRLVHKGDTLPEDSFVYARLLEAVLDKWREEPSQPKTSHDIIIDAGRYDAERLAALRQDIQDDLGNWGRTSVADSRRSAGIQIADVVANSIFNLAIASNRSERIRRILSPFIADETVRVVEFDRL